jgi:hypothetical protein
MVRPHARNSCAEFGNGRRHLSLKSLLPGAATGVRTDLCGWLESAPHLIRAAPYPRRTYPRRSYPRRTYPQRTYPQRSYPQRTYPQRTYPQRSYPQRSYPQRSYPRRTHPQRTLFAAQIICGASRGR